MILPKREVYFRTDYNDKIGRGHFSRCLSIAEIVDKEFSVNFVFNSNYTLVNQLKIEKYKIYFIKDELDFINIIHPNSIVVIDSYEFNEDLQSKINSLNVKLVVIDDLNKIKFDCDAIINHGLFFKFSDYICVSSRTKIYLGLEYLMIRKEFRDKSNTKVEAKVKRKFEKALISLGGSDQNELIFKIVSILASQGVNNFSILGGGEFVHKIVNLVDRKVVINTYSNLNAARIVNLFESNDFAVLPASTILLEAFAVGIPIISGWFVENQKYSLSKFEQLGLLINIDHFNSNELNLNLQNALISLNQNSLIVENQKNLVKLDPDKIKNIFINL